MERRSNCDSIGAAVLVEIDIRDLAVAEHVRVAFDPGLNAITGETGAGKSILVDALEFLLGGRGDASLVRAGATSARVEGIFEFEHELPQDLSRLLDEAGVRGEEGTLIVSRELSTGGRARATARVNGHAVVQATLAAFGSRLVDIHGQSDHVTLLDSAEHIRYLDRFAGTDQARRTLAEQVRRLRELSATLARISADERERLRRQERLGFELNEIAAARVRPDEEAELAAERQLLANAEQLASLSDVAYAALQGGERGAAAVDALGAAADALLQLAELDPRLADDATAAAALQEQAVELARGLREYRDGVEYNPARLAAVEERLVLLSQLKRKYGPTIEEVLAYAERAEAEVVDAEGSEERRTRLEDEKRRLIHEVGRAATALGLQREAAARELVAAVQQQLVDLHLRDARFAIAFSRREDEGGSQVDLALQTLVDGCEALPAPASARLLVDQSGAERVEFQVSFNPGEPLRPLGRVASGGETSRLMLALKSVLGDADAVPTLVFDEIEAGLGGRSGGVVGEKLQRLAGHHQVICITHLPQIAAQASRHLTVAKEVQAGRTHVDVRPLTGEDRLQELASMLGAVTPATLQSARDLLEGASAKPLKSRRRAVRAQI
jgi:DNA repair protein RecN (Recombination protein N)